MQVWGTMPFLSWHIASFQTILNPVSRSFSLWESVCYWLIITGWPEEQVLYLSCSYFLHYDVTICLASKLLSIFPLLVPIIHKEDFNIITNIVMRVTYKLLINHPTNICTTFITRQFVLPVVLDLCILASFVSFTSRSDLEIRIDYIRCLWVKKKW